MHLTTTIILISILFQMSAAVLSLLLIRTTGWRLAWACIALALFLMCVRRSISLVRILEADAYSADLSAELVALAISLLMVVGVALIGPLFSAARRAEKQVRDSEQLFSSIFHATPMATTVTRLSDDVNLDVNAQWQALVGYDRREAVGKTPLELEIWDNPNDRERYAAQVKSSGRVRDFETRLRNTKGETRDVLMNGELVNLNDGPSILTVVQDITQRKKNEAKIIFQANYDSLTELPNRSLFADRLSQAINIARRERTMAALLYIDLDDFKTINDTLGHSAGDKLLKQAAFRLVSAVREEDTVARLGGDEFTIILPGVAKEEAARLVAGKVLDALSQPFLIKGRETHVTASIGITIYPHDGNDPEELLKNADAALYRAKAEGRNTFQFYTPEIQAEVTERVFLEQGLRHALESDELVLHYQPLIDISTQNMIGAEALLRWNHPQRGLLMPGAFISIAEDSNLIIPIGEWVLKQASSQLKAWEAQGRTGLRMTVNLSMRQLHDDNLVPCIAETVRRCDLQPGQLELEITESLLIDNSPETMAVLHKIKSLGVSLAIDDFGTGYSSLSYLKRFPIDTLKIDRSFIRDVPGDTDSTTIIDAILAMAHSLNLTVIGEGVETQEQLAFLSLAGCDIVQGYLLGRPAAPEAMTALLLQQVAAERSPHSERHNGP